MGRAVRHSELIGDLAQSPGLAAGWKRDEKQQTKHERAASGGISEPLVDRLLAGKRHLETAEQRRNASSTGALLNDLCDLLGRKSYLDLVGVTAPIRRPTSSHRGLARGLRGACTRLIEERRRNQSVTFSASSASTEEKCLTMRERSVIRVAG